MKSFDEWMKEQGRQEQQEANEAANPGLKWEEYDQDKDCIELGTIPAGTTTEETRALIKELMAKAIGVYMPQRKECDLYAPVVLKTPEEYQRGFLGEFGKPDPDLEYQEGECCGCGATTEFHNGDYFYCGGSPRCCP